MEVGKKRLNGYITRHNTSNEVTDLRKKNQRLKEILTDLMLCRDVGKKLGHLGISEKYKRRMRLSAAEKQDIIKLVEHSGLGVNKPYTSWYKQEHIL